MKIMIMDGQYRVQILSEKERSKTIKYIGPKLPSNRNKGHIATASVKDLFTGKDRFTAVQEKKAIWTPADQQQALSMGWFIAAVDGALEIQRSDDAPPALLFESDEEALEWVKLAAGLGNDLEIRALAYAGVQ